MTDSPPSRRTRVRPNSRAHYDRDVLHSIIDEALICHVGFVDEGQPFVLPTLHWRQGAQLFLHGSVASRTLRAAAAGEPLCVTMTLVDGLVLARSAFHHSMNYRSAVVLGVAKEVVGEKKRAALGVLVEKVVVGRSAGCRAPSEKELAQTLVVSLPINEASAKIRSGPPVDDEVDYDLDYWAGVIPLTTAAGRPQPDPRLKPGISVPQHVSDYPAEK